jgi:hypothetical protein
MVTMVHNDFIAVPYLILECGEVRVGEYMGWSNLFQCSVICDPAR